MIELQPRKGDGVFYVDTNSVNYVSGLMLHHDLAVR
jgi:hypothetical protein